MSLRDIARRGVRSLGIEVRRVDPGASLGLFLVTLIRDLEVDLVLDVGANEGQFARRLRGEGYTGPLWSFEPGRRAFEALSSGQRDPEWKVTRCALGSEPGELSLNIPAGGTDVASLRMPEPGALEAIGAVGSGMTTETVAVRRLDSFESLAASRRIILKLDTQGFDLEVVRGATGILGRVVAIQTELSFQRLYQGQPSWREMLDELDTLGFVPADFFPNVRGKGWTLVEADCVLVRK